MVKYVDKLYTQIPSKIYLNLISLFSVRHEQHNIFEFIQNETVHYIRRTAHGVRCDNECGKLQVITVFIEIEFKILI